MTWLTARGFLWSEALEAEPARLELSQLEVEAIRPPPCLTVSEWADERRVLQAGTSGTPGRWRTDLTPYLRGIMDAFNDEKIRHIVVKAGTQVGKTEVLFNILGYTVDVLQASTLVVYPREDDAKTVSRTRIGPMFEACPTLRAKLPKKQDLDQLLEKHFPGMVLYLVGANSPAALASKPCPVILRDEVGKFPVLAGSDADPFSLSEARAKSFWSTRKIVDVSSPTEEGKGISKQMATVDVVLRYHVPCPFCGVLQPLDFKRVRWDHAAEGEPDTRYILARSTAVYLCEACEKEIGPEHKAAMLAGGHWEPNRPITDEVERIGFDELSSLYSPFLTFGHVAEQFLRAQDQAKKDGSQGPLQDFVNGWLAQDWVARVGKPQDEAVAEVMGCRADNERGIVPAEAAALVAFGDVQKTGVWWRIRAFAPDMTSWGIDEGLTARWEDLEEILFETAWQKADGSGALRIWRAMLDTGGGRAEDSDISRTEETYHFIRKNQRRGPALFGSKGSSHAMVGKIRIGKPIEKTPSGKAIPGGIQIVILNTEALKDALEWRISQTKYHTPGAWYLHRETPEWVARQICAEERRRAKAGGTEWVQIRRDNHLLDCEVGCLALADPEFFGGVRAVGALAQMRARERAAAAKQPEETQNWATA